MSTIPKNVIREIIKENCFWYNENQAFRNLKNPA